MNKLQEETPSSRSGRSGQTHVKKVANDFMWDSPSATLVMKTYDRVSLPYEDVSMVYVVLKANCNN